jgi:hypothetical protein
MAVNNQINFPVVDEDDMISDSDGFICTQQSIKAYVDAQVGGGSNLVPIQTVEPSGAASQDFIDLSDTYIAYLFSFNLAPSTASNLYVRTSTNNGSSFNTGASDYAWGGIGDVPTAGDNSDSYILIATGYNNNAISATDGVQGIFILQNPTNASYKTSAQSFCSGRSFSTPTRLFMGCGGIRNTAEDNDAIQVGFQGVNMTGIITQFGIKGP